MISNSNRSGSVTTHEDRSASEKRPSDIRSGSARDHGRNTAALVVRAPSELIISEGRLKAVPKGDQPRKGA
jgi:hypothetical protein